jgi:hypothetical protein
MVRLDITNQFFSVFPFWITTTYSTNNFLELFLSAAGKSERFQRRNRENSIESLLESLHLHFNTLMECLVEHQINKVL